jgi:hypothetical protein
LKHFNHYQISVNCQQSWCAGKKTALLQAEALARVLGLANVLFCGSAVSFFFFLTAKLPLSLLS